jgi:hypothetical protein
VTVQDAPDFWGRAFFSSLFADPVQQPMTVLPPYRASAALDAQWGASQLHPARHRTAIGA